MQVEPPLPSYLREILGRFVDESGRAAVLRWLRPPDLCMTPEQLSAVKSSRVSFARLLSRRMLRERWQIRRLFFNCDAEGDGHARYAIRIGRYDFTYVVRTFRWDGVEKVGRRADGANRDLFAALFQGVPEEARIAREIATFNIRDYDVMRTDAMVTGWTPANCSARFFEHVVESLTAGRQPDPAVIGTGTGYMLRNGGYLANGRHGTVSYESYPADHPFRHPYFADMFGLYLVRQISIDWVNAIAAARNPTGAVKLASDVARYIGIGNSSGQGMCVALQRWPHWVATWVTVRELALAYAKSRSIVEDPGRGEALCELLERARLYYDSVQVQCEDYVVPHQVLAANLETMRSWVTEALGNPSDRCWGDLVCRAQASFDPESLEQVNSLLIDTYPEFADAVAEYLPIGADRTRDVVPEMTVGTLRDLVGSRYNWALRRDMRTAEARAHFWYHSQDSGEQRRGDRVLDPHEHFESFMDHISAVQRLACVLTVYNDDTPVAEVIADTPELAYEISRVQYLADLPYSEIRGNLIARGSVPAHLIRFLLAVLGMECTNPLSIRYVRGVFYQGMPLADELATGMETDWSFPASPVVAEAEVA